MTPPGDDARGPARLTPIDPQRTGLAGITPVPRTFHQDPRGFLLETLRSDDASVSGAHFRMSYSSLTLPGQYRDADRWHVHQIQTDRFVVILGEMMLALLDRRPASPTFGRLEVLRMLGAPSETPSDPSRVRTTTCLVPVPPGVLHCIGNLGTEPFLLQNFPTELYNPSDEGRVPFSSLPVESLKGPFSWSLVGHRTSDGPQP